MNWIEIYEIYWIASNTPNFRYKNCESLINMRQSENVSETGNFDKDIVRKASKLEVTWIGGGDRTCRFSEEIVH